MIPLAKKKILLTIIALIVLVLVNFLYRKILIVHNQGEVTIVVIDENKSEVINQKVSFKEEDTLQMVLERNFDVDVKNKMLVGIEGISADTKDYFLKLYINCQAANYGISDIKLKDGDEIRIVYTKVGDYSDPC